MPTDPRAHIKITPQVTSNVRAELDQAFPFIATCRDPDCVMHIAPARFSDYEDRARAVGEHRLRTGHTVDYSRVVQEDS